MAIAQGLNNLQVTEALNWSGLTTDNHLYRIRANDVQLESDIVTQIHGRYMNKFGFESILNKYPVKYLDTDGDYKWYLRGDINISVPVLSFSAPDSAKPGVGKSIFYLTVAEKRFVSSEHIFFDDLNHSVRIMGDGESNGSGGWVYPVKHMKPSMSYFVPPVLMQAGKKVNKMFNSDTNTLGKEYGGIDFTSQFEMRNVFSTRSKKYTVPANMLNRPLLIGLKSSDGTVEKTWTRYQDLEFEWQWKQEGLRHLIYSEFNMNNDGSYDTLGTSGFPIKQGAGLRQQISPSYRILYNYFSLDLLAEVGRNLSINILPEDERHFVLMTGERGMELFSRAVENKIAVFHPLGDERRLTVGNGIDSLGWGGQYRQYKAYNGVVWTVVHMPEYDNPQINRIPHPEGGYTENYRMTIFNIGTTNGQPNIQIMKPKGADKKWYVAGSTSPFGPLNGGAGASNVDGYDIYRRETIGIMLRNPLSACELIPNVSVMY
jgi:hypothetical protein